MYPRNAASPERIAVGAVVQISDGAVQTSGVSISVRGQGGVSGAGAGTTAYDNGIVEYTPTQGETDFTSFVVVAYKTGCIPVAQTIVTSASATPGYAGTDQDKIANATATVNLSGTTVKTATDVETDTANIQTRLPAALVSGRIDASVGAMEADVVTATAIAAGAIDAATFAADVDAKILSYIVDDATRIDASSLNTATVTTIPAIIIDTAEIGVAGAGLTEAGGTGDQLTAVPWNAAWDAEVQSEVQDALDAAVTELTAVPADNASLAQAIKYCFMRAKNKYEQTATTQTGYQGDGTTVFETATVSDDATTFTRGEFGTA